ncbi:MAG: DUF1232 domain-containing protein [Nitrospiraceae bacterium]|nr:DUF1232 domain-containing protein [Nitrospiraceae bacterium]
MTKDVSKRLFLQSTKQWAKTIRRDVLAIRIAARDSRTPLIAKLLALAVAAYAASPIDLIPDFIPVLGFLDDLIILPLGIILVVRLIPPELMSEYRETASELTERPASYFAASLIIIFWLASVFLLVRALL